MRRLLIVGNPFQLMLALLIRINMFNDGAVTDLLFFESVSGWRFFKENLEELGLFRKVFSIAEVQPRGNRGKKIKDIFLMISGRGEQVDYITDSELIHSDYDEVWYYNYCPWFYCIYDLSLTRGKVVRFIAYMESVFVYTYLRHGGMIPRIFLRERIIAAGRKMNHKWVFNPYSETVYVQFPEMTNRTDEIDIRRITQGTKQEELSLLVKRVFNAPSFANLPKYIFMASSLEFDGFGEGETDLIISIAEMVGRENLVVKLHPRDKRGLVEKAGIRVLEASNVCWEAIQAVNDFSNHVFFTIASASIINSELFTGQDVKAYYLYPLIEKTTPIFREYCSKSVGQTLDMVHENGKALNTLVLRSFEDLKVVLKGDLS